MYFDDNTRANGSSLPLYRADLFTASAFVDLERLDLQAIDGVLFDTHEVLRSLLTANPRLRSLRLEALIVARAEINADLHSSPTASVELLYLQVLNLSCRCNDIIQILNYLVIPAIAVFNFTISYHNMQCLPGSIAACAAHGDLRELAQKVRKVHVYRDGIHTYHIAASGRMPDDITIRFVPLKHHFVVPLVAAPDYPFDLPMQLPISALLEPLGDIFPNIIRLVAEGLESDEVPWDGLWEKFSSIVEFIWDDGRRVHRWAEEWVDVW